MHDYDPDYDWEAEVYEEELLERVKYVSEGSCYECDGWMHKEGDFMVCEKCGFVVPVELYHRMITGLFRWDD